MIHLRDATPRLFIAAGQVLALLFLSIAALGFQPFYFGYWNAEPIAFGTYVLSAAIAFWIAVGFFTGWISVAWPRRNALLYLWMAWIGWQVVATFMSANPWRSWFGPPEQTEGLAWYLSASLFMLLLACVWRSERFGALVLGYSFAVLVILSVLHSISDEQNNMLGILFFPDLQKKLFIHLLPFVWPDYLGLMAGWWWIAFMVAYRGPLRWQLLAGMVMILILLVSSNHGAMIILGYGLLITLVVRAIQLTGGRHYRIVSKTWRQLATIALLLPVLWLIGSPYIPARYDGSEAQSIPTRVLMNHISMRALSTEPSRLVFGKGWGQYADDFFRNSLVRDVRAYEDGQHRFNWPMARGYNYHSHNMAAETLLSLGAIGFILWLLLPIVVVRRIPEEHFWAVVPMLVAVTLLSHFWFAMPQSMPYQALSWLMLMRIYPADQTPRHFPHPLAGLLSLCIVAAFAWSSYQQAQAIRFSMHLTDPYGQRYGFAMDEATMEEDIKRGGDRLRNFYIITTKRVAQFEDGLKPKHGALYNQYIQAMEALAADPRTGAYNAGALMYGYNVMVTTVRSPIMKEVQKRVNRHYFTYAKLHTKRAPDREDIIAPYLYAMMGSKSDVGHERLMGAIGELLEIHPSHRSALWLGGKILSGQPEFREQGVGMMRAAIALGVDRIYPIKREDLVLP